MAEIISNPLFKKGYEHFWSGEEPVNDTGWFPNECEAYSRGRMFAAWLAGEGEGKVPLTRGYLAHPRAETLLLRAMHAQEVL